jgi:hypothetical protein
MKKIYSLVFVFMVSFAMTMSIATGSPSCNPIPHGPIQIVSDSDFTQTNGVIAGTGTTIDPYIIGNWQIKNLSNGYGIKVDNSEGKITKSFKMQCIQSNFDQIQSSGTKLIWIVNIHSPTIISDIQGNSLDAPGVIGVELDNSSNIILDSLSLNRIGKHAVLLQYSDHISIFRSKLKADGDGLRAENSHHLIIGSLCNLYKGTDCNEFTYDDEKGIWLQNSHDVLIQYTITSADDSGGIVVDGKNSYNVSIFNGTASGNGPICRTNPSTGNREPTGVKIDFIAGIAIINGAHDVNIKDYTIQGDAHYGIMNGGDGKYLNPCTRTVENLLPMTPKGGNNLDLNGNCYSTQFGFDPQPTNSCKKR